MEKPIRKSRSKNLSSITFEWNNREYVFKAYGKKLEEMIPKIPAIYFFTI
jgi:hypothetical protein